MRIGLFGGTFDPLHIAHLIVAECARDHFELARVLFIPAGVPPHKAGARLSLREHRWEMTRRAVADHPTFEACDIEIRRDGRSFTIDTIRALRALNPGDTFYMIIGEDSLRDMPQWRAPDAILRESTVVVARRPLDGPATTLPSGVEVFPAPRLEISSTMIRDRVSRGRSIRCLVPPAVEAYIRETGLYRAGGPGNEESP